MGSEQAARVIRYRDLEPSWHVPKAKEPGYLRWLVNWVGGGEGYINANPGVAAVSERYVVGLMCLPKGNRQSGIHTHCVTEIYVVLSGELEGVDGDGALDRAGPLDCMYIPPGVPHGVRSCGDEDAYFVWIHDRLEKKGTSTYAEPGDSTVKEGIRLARFKELEPSWEGRQAREAGFLRWSASFVDATGAPGQPTVVSDRLALALMVILPGNKQPVATSGFATTYVSLDGGLMAALPGGNAEVGRLDAVYVPPGTAHSLRNFGRDPAHVLCVVDGATRFA